MRTIYLIRHCEPALPPGTRRCISSTDVPLSDPGHAQGERLHSCFANISLTGVYTSPLLRARQTAGYLSPWAEVISELRELGVGDWEGLPFSEIRRQWPELYALRGEDPITHVMPGGEPPADCLRRALAALHTLLARTEGDIAVVTHAGVNRLILSHLLGLDLRKFFTLPQPCGCVNLLREENGNLTVLKTGIMPERTHLIF